MPNPEPADPSQLIRNARQRAEELVRAFATASNGPEPVSTTCERASTVLDRYCSDLLDYMLVTFPPSTPAEATWLRTHYLTLIVEFGSAVRDAIADSETRHAAAQGIQYRVLEHERHLKPALEAALLASSTPKAAEEAPMAPPESYLSRPDITGV